jgi:hypothetical protein
MFGLKQTAKAIVYSLQEWKKKNSPPKYLSCRKFINLTSCINDQLDDGIREISLLQDVIGLNYLRQRGIGMWVKILQSLGR